MEHVRIACLDPLRQPIIGFPNRLRPVILLGIPARVKLAGFLQFSTQLLLLLLDRRQ